jgi:hypothetical protein
MAHIAVRKITAAKTNIQQIEDGSSMVLNILKQHKLSNGNSVQVIMNHVGTYTVRVLSPNGDIQGSRIFAERPNALYVFDEVTSIDNMDDYKVQL